jgi:acyl-CoA reductase-like NAD-dependent aldehyde dehydrogenase
VNETQYNQVLNYIESGKAEGAKVLAGGNKINRKGYFIEPTVFGDVKVQKTICLLCHSFFFYYFRTS